MLKTLKEKREIKLFEFSRVTSTEELRINKNEVTLQFLHFAVTQRHFVMAM